MNNTVKTALDICNLALAKLGERPISAITPNGTPAQRFCYQFYHTVRREVLCVNKWKFAVRTVSRPFETKFEGVYGYTLPLDCLRVLKPAVDKREIRNRVLFCSEPEINLIYISDVEDVEQFEPRFIEAFATRLASELCLPLTFSVMMVGKLDNEYQNLKDA